MAEHAVLSGAEPFSATGGPHGVLVVHGFTGYPQSMRGLAEAFAGGRLHGRAAAAPRSRHDGRRHARPPAGPTGRARPRRRTTSWPRRCDKVVVAGLSMGGTLTVWLAAHHPEIAGIVRDQPARRATRRRRSARSLRSMLADGHAVMPGIGSDIADPDVQRAGLRRHAARAAALAVRGGRRAARRSWPTSAARCSSCTSPQDHVVPSGLERRPGRRRSGPGGAGHARAQLPRRHPRPRQGRDRGAAPSTSPKVTAPVTPFLAWACRRDLRDDVAHVARLARLS